MKSFLTALSAVALAGAIYVATASGSQMAGPTAKQFKALQKEVTTLKKQVKGLTFVTVIDATLLQDCMTASVPINQFGDPNGTYGYAYTPNGGAPTLTTALDVTSKDDANALWITGGGSTCGTDLSSAARAKAARMFHLHSGSAPRVVFQARQK
jgi:hypothetical protein